MCACSQCLTVRTYDLFATVTDCGGEEKYEEAENIRIAADITTYLWNADGMQRH